MANKNTIGSYSAHTGIVALSLLLIIFNLIFGKVDYSMATDDVSYYSNVDAEQSISFAKSAVGYIPFVDDNPDEFALALLIDKNEGFVSKDFSDNSLSTEIADKDFEYAIQQGDTITTIAKKFNLHVASIIERNGLDVNSIESISPGEVIVIPAIDISSSQDWLVALNAKKEKERQIALKLEQDRLAKLAKANKTKLASGNRSVVYRDSGSFRGSSSLSSFIVPISSNGISRRLQRGHYGIDYRANVGTPVRSSASGRVIGITGGWGGGFGNSVLLDNGGGVTTRYAHLSSVKVGLGDTVGQGATLGLSGNTGFSTGPHLHFETRVNGTAVDPF